MMTTIPAHAAWHTGRVVAVGTDYNQKLVFKLEGVSASGCICASWSGWMCLDASRNSVSGEYAILLTARTTGKIVSVYVNSSCYVEAMNDEEI